MIIHKLSHSMRPHSETAVRHKISEQVIAYENYSIVFKDEVQAWLNEQGMAATPTIFLVEGETQIWLSMMAYFDSDDDAMLFRLRWSQ